MKLSNHFCATLYLFSAIMALTEVGPDKPWNVLLIFFGLLTIWMAVMTLIAAGKKE